MKNTKVLLAENASLILEDLKLQANHSNIPKTILSAIYRKIELLKSNFQFGDPLAKNLIPKYYLENYGITNLFRVELSSYWRMLYTVQRGEVEAEVIVLIVDILDHKHYDKKFGYKKR